MKILKKLALTFVVAAISSGTYANVVELDAYNADHCRQQLLNSGDELPIIATYTTDSYDGNSPAFIKKFEALAKQHPERTFFKWNQKNDVIHVTQTLCLQQLGFTVTPSMIILGVFKDNKSQGFISSPFRLDWAGEMTIAEMNKFIDIPESSMKKTVLAQNS